MPESKWAELFQFTSTCRYLTHLSLSLCNLRESGSHLAQSVMSWNDDPPLETLDLSHCSIPEEVWPELLESLSSCEHLSHLNLSGNNIGEAGHYLTQAIKSWGDDPPLNSLDLSHCSMPEQVWPELLQTLSSCEQLSYLNISGNTITGCLYYFMSDPNPNPVVTYLSFFSLECTRMNKSDIQHLIHLIQSNKLPCLKDVYLQETNWTGEELQQLKKACASHPNGQSILCITSDNNNKEKVKRQTSLKKNKQVEELNQYQLLYYLFFLT